MKENTWKHNINSGKAAQQSPACHLQFKLLAAVLGNKNEKLDNDPGNTLAVSTATSVQVVLHFFSWLEENRLECAQQAKAFAFLL